MFQRFVMIGLRIEHFIILTSHSLCKEAGSAHGLKIGITPALRLGANIGCVNVGISTPDINTDHNYGLIAFISCYLHW